MKINSHVFFLSGIAEKLNMKEEILDEIVVVVIAKEKRKKRKKKRKNENEANVRDPENESVINGTNHVTNVTKSVKNGNQSMERLKLKKSPSMMVSGVFSFSYFYILQIFFFLFQWQTLSRQYT